ncbi:MAG: HlyD family efflux transporter periplasmic adaptor subunit [Candidatus Marinimicrobia bacterium]|nr:HlyD family efflux transporter periplasmic adaptor subunit [Candidatus Neomarinimicrobiota bacterium]
MKAKQILKMTIFTRTFTWLIALVLLVGCSGNHQKSDAYGNFEVIETTISSEANGKILNLDIDAGQQLEAGVIIGNIDSTDLSLRKATLQAQRSAVESKISNIKAQVAVQVQQQKTLLTEKNRIEKLLKDGAATTKQMDDIKANLDLLNKQIVATKTQENSVRKELIVFDRQIDQLEENIKKCQIVNPVTGTVLNKYAEAGELTGIGKTLYNIADLSEMDLRIYVSGDQIPDVRLGDKVEVLIDSDKKNNRSLEGIISWIASSAEFTPKTIQTKAERVNLVYAVKVKVRNDGSLKIGMPGEVNFLSSIK